MIISALMLHNEKGCAPNLRYPQGTLGMEIRWANINIKKLRISNFAEIG